jgi:hypothetical protein
MRPGRRRLTVGAFPLAVIAFPLAAGAIPLAAVATLFAAAPLHAQVDIEALRPEGPPPGRSGSLGGSLTVRTGNVDLVELDLNGRYYSVSEGVTTLVAGTGGLGFLGGDRFASSGLLHYRRTYRTGASLSPEHYAQVNYDRPQRLTLRLLAGAGVRAPVVDGEWGQLGAGTSLMMEREELDLAAGAVHPSETTVVRSSTFVSGRAVAGRLVVTSTTYVQPSVEDWGDVRILEALRLAAPIADALALTVSFDLRYDSGPPDGIAALDTRLETGVTYTF